MSVKLHAEVNGKVNVNLTVDGDKIQADADAVKEKAEELSGKAKDASEKLIQ